MKIMLASPRGFCAGVNMAIESLEKALDFYGAPVFVFHEIVHNHSVVERFKKRGVVFVDNLNSVPQGAILLYSAHGVAPVVRQQSKERGHRVIDATCPLVTKVHLEALRFAKQGYAIVLIGHEGHDEVVGTMGEASEVIRLVQSVKDVENLSLPDDAKLAYLTQTTLSVRDAKAIIDALKDRFPAIVGPARQDICYATTNRQEAVDTLANEADLVLVLGSENSSNSQRLVEMARSRHKPAHLIEDVKAIQPAWLSGVGTVVITAGASAPEDLVQRCVEYLRHQYGASVEERVLRKEFTHFPIPKVLQKCSNANALFSKK